MAHNYFIGQIRGAMVMKNLPGLAKASQEFAKCTDVSGSPAYARVLLEVADYLADKQPYVLDALKSAVVAHNELDDFALKERARDVWKKAFRNLPEPILRGIRVPNDKVEGFVITEQQTTSDNPLYHRAHEEWYAYYESLKQTKSAVFGKLEQRLMQDIKKDDAMEKGHSQPLSPEKTFFVPPELSMPEAERFVDEFRKLAGLPKGGPGFRGRS